MNKSSDEAKSVNGMVLQDMMNKMFYGVPLTKSHLYKCYKQIVEYLSTDITRVHPCLHSLRVSATMAGCELQDVWMSVESDGTVDVPQGERYRLSQSSIENIPLLCYPYYTGASK